jgi:quercetin dioxygenase-like cupin family protein
MGHLPNRRRYSAAVVVSGLLPLVAVASVSSASLADVEPNTSAHGVTVELLSRGTVAKPFKVDVRGIELKTKRRIDVAVAHLTFEPGGSTGWHRHPGPTVVTITTGELTITDRKCHARTFEAGDTFVEEGPPRHLAVNTANTATETIVTFFVPPGTELTTPLPAPRRCRD